MIEGKKFIKDANVYFNYLISEFGFKVLSEKIRGNTFYDLQYSDGKRILSVSYENIEDYLQIIIFILQNGELPDYDDKTKTLHLNKLNEQILPKVDRNEIAFNNEYFMKFKAQDALERQLLKSAKELRLCLKHLNYNVII